MGDRRNHGGSRMASHYAYVIFFLSLILSLRPTSSEAKSRSSTHFVLIHGACLGAWSWYKLVPLLRSLGHNVTALDLAASGINPQQTIDIPSIADYFDPLMDFMGSLDSHERAILVGHSLGGLAISLAMEKFPKKISVAFFVTAFMPGATLNISTLNQESSRRQTSFLDSRYTYDDGPSKPPTTFIFGPLFSSTHLYQLSSIQDLALAIMLLRPLHLYSQEDMSKVLMLSRERYGSVDRVFIIADEDKTIKKDFQEWMIEKNPPNEVQEINGSDHMVMISKPIELSVHLLAIAEKYS